MNVKLKKEQPFRIKKKTNSDEKNKEFAFGLLNSYQTPLIV